MTSHDLTEILKDTSGAIERHYTVAEVATMWSLSNDSIRRIFRRQPGVLVFRNSTGINSEARIRNLTNSTISSRTGASTVSNF